MPQEIVYRYEDVHIDSAFVGIQGLGSYDFSRIVPDEYKILKYTSKGMWVSRYPYPTTEKRFINTTAIKQFAYRDKQKAINAYIKRRQCQLRLLYNQFVHCEDCLRAAEQLEREHLR